MTRIASVLVASVLWLTGLTAAHARSFEILLVRPTKAGGLRLPPGQYRVSVDGGDAVFLDVRTERSFRTRVKVENSGATYETTRIRTSKRAGDAQMNAIEFEGSDVRIEFL